MRVRIFLTTALAFACLATPLRAVIVYSENFETDGNGTRYSTSITEFYSGPDDHFGRSSAGAISADDDGGDGVYNGAVGTFFAMEDADGLGGSLPGTLTTLLPINVAGTSSASFSMLFAAGSSGSASPSYENDDFVQVFIDFDGAGTFATQLLGFETPVGPRLASPSNQHIHQDVDFDGLGEGAQVTDTFAIFTSTTIPTAGFTTAAIRIVYDAGATSEEFAFDNLALDVVPVPEPAASLLGLLGSGLLFLRRRR